MNNLDSFHAASELSDECNAVPSIFYSVIRPSCNSLRYFSPLVALLLVFLDIINSVLRKVTGLNDKWMKLKN